MIRAYDFTLTHGKSRATSASIERKIIAAGPVQAMQIGLRTTPDIAHLRSIVCKPARRTPCAA